MLSHQRECAGCETFVQKLEAFERTLAEAIRIDVPEELASQVLLAHSLRLKADRRVRRRRLRVSVAAGLVLGVVGSWLALRPEPLDREVLSHIEKEASHLAERRELSPEQVNEVLATLDITVAGDLGTVHYAGTCWIHMRLGAHLVLSGEKGPVTVLLLPDQRVAGRIPIRDRSLRGIIVPVEWGSIAIVGEPGEALDVIERRLRHAVRIATRGRNAIEQNA
jgi:hypothetical protein